jgi:hypothetical protein
MNPGENADLEAASVLHGKRIPSCRKGLRRMAAGRLCVWGPNEKKAYLSIESDGLQDR